MKTIKYEVKLEKSVKVILGAFAFGIILNAFVSRLLKINLRAAIYTNYFICHRR